MKPVERTWLSYRQVRAGQRSLSIRVAEVPVEHALSLPVPTRRWPEPAFAQFAAPTIARRDDAAGPELLPPDRWWAIDARSGRLLAYALTAVVPIEPGRSFPGGVVPPIADSLSEIRAILSEFDAAMEGLIPEFFLGEAGPGDLRARLVELFARLVPAHLRNPYLVLAPDFFTWLEAAGSP